MTTVDELEKRIALALQTLELWEYKTKKNENEWPENCWIPSYDDVTNLINVLQGKLTY